MTLSASFCATFKFRLDCCSPPLMLFDERFIGANATKESRDAWGRSYSIGSFRRRPLMLDPYSRGDISTDQTTVDVDDPPTLCPTPTVGSCHHSLAFCVASQSLRHGYAGGECTGLLCALRLSCSHSGNRCETDII